MEDKITCLIVEPGKEPIITDLDNTLEAKQEVVGGYIETVYPFPDNVVLICNEEGKLNGSPLNRAVVDRDNNIVDIISGTFIVVGIPADPEMEDFVSLTPEQIDTYSDYYKEPQQFLRINGQILAFPLPEQPEINIDYDADVEV